MRTKYLAISMDVWRHMSKAHAIAYMPMVLASVMFTYRKKMFLGGVLTALTVALEIYCNHFQITYFDTKCFEPYCSFQLKLSR